MVQNRVFYGLLLAGAVLLYIFTNTYYTLTLLILMILLPLISLGLMLACRGHLNIRLEVPDTGEKDEAVLTYTFENTGAMPIARILFLVELENLLAGSKSSRWIHGAAGSKKTLEAKLRLKNSKAGSVVISTKKIRIYDAFGLFALPKADLPDQMIVIYPRMGEQRVRLEKPVETTGDGSRYAPHRPGQDVSEIFALREYGAGDEVRKIHWKLSSKLDKMMVRDFSLPLNYSLFLLAELNFENEDMADAVLEVYLSLSRSLLESGMNHNLSWYDAGEGEFYVRELDDFEDLEAAAARLLSSCASPKKSAALDYYAASGYYNSRSTLVYVAAEPDLDRVSELEVLQPMRTICIYDDKQEQSGQEFRQDGAILRISVKQAEEGGLEIMV